MEPLDEAKIFEQLRGALLDAQTAEMDADALVAIAEMEGVQTLETFFLCVEAVRVAWVTKTRGAE